MKNKYQNYGKVITDQKWRAYCDLISNNWHKGDATETAGIHRMTMWRYEQKMEAEYAAYGEGGPLTKAVKRYQQLAVAKGEHKTNLRRKAAETSRGAIWLLRKEDPDEYGDADFELVTGMVIAFMMGRGMGKMEAFIDAYGEDIAGQFEERLQHRGITVDSETS